jgi:hypothetical protein
MLTFTAVLLMLLLDTAMWFIDIHDAISEITLTLTSTSNLSLSDRYALTDNLPFPVETALYAFMVTLLGSHQILSMLISKHSLTSGTPLSYGEYTRSGMASESDGS